MFDYNDNKAKILRKNVRNNATDTERMLWSRLRKSQLNGYKFRRNYQVLRYYVDFYCPEKRLAIEVDGKIHNTDHQKEYDEIRDKEIESLDIKVIRFSNNEINKNIESVLQIISHELTTSPS